MAKPDDFCPFDPTEPRCRECRGIPCGDDEADDAGIDYRDLVRQRTESFCKAIEEVTRLALNSTVKGVEWRDPHPLSKYDTLEDSGTLGGLGR